MTAEGTPPGQDPPPPREPYPTHGSGQPPPYYPPPQYPPQGYPPPQRSGGSMVLKITLGVILGGMVLIGGCAVACLAATGSFIEDVDREFKKDEQKRQKRAITNRQARSIPLGTPKQDVIDQLGRPSSTQEGENEGLGRDSCIYYDVRGGDVLDMWQFCFDSQDRLESRNR